MGAPIGNQNAKQGAEWRSAIKRALTRRSGENWRKGLDELADRYIEAAAAGDAWALKDVADRLDGKPAQSTRLESDGPLTIGLVDFSSLYADDKPSE